MRETWWVVSYWWIEKRPGEGRKKRYEQWGWQTEEGARDHFHNMKPLLKTDEIERLNLEPVHFDSENR